MSRQLKILHNFSECTVIINEEGKIEYANPAMENTFGYRPIELVGRSINILVPNTKSHVHQNYLTKYFKNPKDRKMGAGKELYGVHKSGITIPIEVSLSYLEVDGKRMSMAIVIDISERKKILDELSYSQSLYLSLVENTTDHILQIDRKLNVLYINHVSPGLTREQVIGSSFLDLIPGEEMKKKVQNTLRNVFEKGKPDSYELEFYSPVGLLHYVTTANPVIEHGKVRGINLVTRDMTKDMNLKNELVKQQKFIEKIDNFSINGIYIYDLKENRITYINKRFEEILGYNMNEINEMSAEKLVESFNKDETEKVHKFIAEVSRIKPGKSMTNEFRLRNKNGDRVWCLTNNSGFQYDDEGNVLTVIGAFIDITQQKNVEESLLMKNIEMENFAFRASHDLKSPLNSIIQGLTLIIDNKKMDEDSKIEIQEQIIHSAHRMGEMVNSLLAHAQIDTKQDIEDIDCNTIIKEVEIDLKSLITENKARIKYKDLPIVSGVKALIRILLQNLVSNSIKYKGENRKPLIEIIASEQVDYWLFICKDNGMGIMSENLERIFELFDRAGANSGISGSGIGLANCKKIVKVHGGEIWVESEFGKGSNFYFTISKPENYVSGRTKRVNSLSEESK